MKIAVQLSGRPSVWTFMARIPRYTFISAARITWQCPSLNALLQLFQMMQTPEVQELPHR